MLIRSLKRTIAATAAMLAVIAASSAAAPSALLTILTSADAETQAMALILSNQAAAAGTPVHVLLCGPAGDIALDNPPESATEVVTPAGMSVRSLLEALMTKGGRVDVCAIYLPNRKLTAEALIEGVGAATPAAIAAEMLVPETRLATF